jgi:GT2 family glycosyltransferase
VIPPLVTSRAVTLLLAAPLRRPGGVVQNAMPPRRALTISASAAPFGARLAAALPPGAAGQWCMLRLALPDAAPWWAKLELTDEARGQIVREVFLGKPYRHAGHTWRATLVHIPGEARAITLCVFGSEAAAHLDLRILSRGAATALLLARFWRVLPAALSGSPLGVLGRIRTLLGQAPARAGDAPPYATWIALFETAAAPPPDTPWDVQVAVIAGALDATQASLKSAARQIHGPAPACVIAGAQDWHALTAAWVIPLQAGEILNPRAVSLFAQAARTCPSAAFLTADCDSLAADGTRTDPLLKPGPDPLLLQAGLPLRGACAIQWQNVPERLPLRIHHIRSLMATRAGAAIAHVPGILSHVPQDCQTAEAYQNSRPPAPGAGKGALPGVTAIVPSAARGWHVAQCLGRIVHGTDYPGLHVKLVISDPPAARRKILQAVARLPHTSIIEMDTGAFNYPRVNNDAARSVTSDLLLLLNDDVAPISPAWLRAMAAHMADPAVGIVGARLLYGNGLVQHEGVIVGLANLCEHAGRLRDGASPGPHGIGVMDRQVSAVTAACLLIRTSLYRALGGMDEAYAVALNDVDLCLRARQAGWRVVYCAGATLHHYESLSLGRHYAGSRAGLEAVEVRRLRARLGALPAGDPFYSPLASLQPGREWMPAFPPRPHPPAMLDAIAAEPPQGPSYGA